MSMPPFFPSLVPPIANSLWFDVDVPCDDEAEVTQMEGDHQNWINEITNMGSDFNPIGKLPTEHLDPADSDDEDANDDSEGSESHDDEDDDDMDVIDASRETDTLERDVMETNRSPGNVQDVFLQSN